jgi:hypothetical protein
VPRRFDDFGGINSGRVYVYAGFDGALIKVIDNPEANVNFGQGLAVTPSGQIAVGNQIKQIKGSSPLIFISVR